jgi:hypothetical protein
MEAGLGTHTNPPVRNLSRHHYSLPQKPSGTCCASALVHCTFGYCEEGLLQRCRSAGRGDNDWTKRRHCDHAARLVARIHYLFFEVYGLNGKKYFFASPATADARFSERGPGSVLDRRCLTRRCQRATHQSNPPSNRVCCAQSHSYRGSFRKAYRSR